MKSGLLNYIVWGVLLRLTSFYASFAMSMMIFPATSIIRMLTHIKYSTKSCICSDTFCMPPPTSSSFTTTYLRNWVGSCDTHFSLKKCHFQFDGWFVETDLFKTFGHLASIHKIQVILLPTLKKSISFEHCNMMI